MSCGLDLGTRVPERLLQRLGWRDTKDARRTQAGGEVKGEGQRRGTEVKREQDGDAEKDR